MKRVAYAYPPRRDPGRGGRYELRVNSRFDSHRHAFTISRRIASEVCEENALPSARRGRREYRVRAAPAVSCANCAKESAHEHTGSAEAIRHSLRNGFNAYIVLSPVIGLV